MGTGQFCTNPGIVLLLAGVKTEDFVTRVASKFSASPVGTLLNGGVQSGLEESVGALQSAGATLVTGGQTGGGSGYSFANTLLRVSGSEFIENAEALQTEAFGNESLFVIAADVNEAVDIAHRFEGNLTGSVYSDASGEDDELYDVITPILRRKVGRLLNDKMPTGVAVSSAMNHGGPYPATGHPGFTAVGIPASLRRFAMLQCFDNVRQHRLPAELRDGNPLKVWRLENEDFTRG